MMKSVLKLNSTAIRFLKSNIHRLPSTTRSPVSCNFNLQRCYSIGMYDKHMQAVTSGKGKKNKGRRVVNEKAFNKFGSAIPEGMAIPEHIPQKRQDNMFTIRKMKREDRGWCGISWGGRHAGPPESQNGKVLEDFDSIVVEMKRLITMRGTGKERKLSAMVVVGNKKGQVGWATGKSELSAVAAIRKARNKAVNYLHHFPICDGHTIYHSFQTPHVNNTCIKFERQPAGYGIRSQRILKAICELAGIKDIRMKIYGPTTPITVVQCAFMGFQMQETHQELAERIGKNVVEYRPERGNYPFIVASPSEYAMKRRMKQEKKQQKRGVKEPYFKVAFDPFMGAHRPKSIREIQGTHPDLLNDLEGYIKRM